MFIITDLYILLLFYRSVQFSMSIGNKLKCYVAFAANVRVLELPQFVNVTTAFLGQIVSDDLGLWHGAPGRPAGCPNEITSGVHSSVSDRIAP